MRVLGGSLALLLAAGKVRGNSCLLVMVGDSPGRKLAHHRR